ncbi:hypothetical protein D5085_02935 [Ectothiorhodospiraceae bacterium BW-2]|nr:hypothetical protein D5085_02935 [Ectothiorhodospiraceae bacterium BW-2]
MRFPRTIPPLLLTLLLPLTPQAEPVVIAHSGVADSALSGQDVKNIFLGKKSRWSNNESIQFAIADTNLPFHEDFLKNYLQRNANQFTLHWRKAVFTGTGAEPKKFDDATALLDFVRSTPGAISYIDNSLPHDGVKVLTIN